MVKSLRITKLQFWILVVFSVLISVWAIIHGIFFDLAFDEIKRLTLGGLLFTFLVVFPGVLFLEWAFDINNKRRLDALNQRIDKLEKRCK